MNFLSWFRDVIHRMSHIEQLLISIDQGVKKMASNLDTLTQAVKDEEGAVDSLITLVSGLSEYIRANVGNGQALLDLATELDAKKQAIADAVLTNPVPPT